MGDDYHPAGWPGVVRAVAELERSNRWLNVAVPDVARAAWYAREPQVKWWAQRKACWQSGARFHAALAHLGYSHAVQRFNKQM